MLSKTKNEKLTKIVLSLMPFGLILINIKLFNIGEAAFKPIHIIVLITIVVGLTKGVSYKRLLILLFYSMVPMLALNNIVSYPAFLSTYLIYLMSLMLLFLGMPSLLKSNKLDIQKVFILLFRAFNFTALYGILQFVLANFFDDYRLYNNLGRFQFHPHLDNQIFGIIRATSIYIEPSVFAWIATTVLVLVVFLYDHKILSENEKKITVSLCLLSLLIAFSAAGFVSLIFILMIYNANAKLSYHSILINGLILLSLILILVIEPGLIKYLRLSEITRQNTSGYIRIVEPFYAMKDVMSNYPLFGRGLGQIGVFDQNLQYNMNIHNSLYGSIITFGVMSAAYYIPILFKFSKIIKQNKKSVLLIINLLFIFLTTGSFLSLELPLIYCLYIFAIKYKNDCGLMGEE